ncbi:hypothetical protein DXB46_10380 [Lachnospiraceae bacterium OM04-12BH]|nr:hypothetical protein DXB46_10380 [Lachnospiraceae bacterium OM04-12BH]
MPRGQGKVKRKRRKTERSGAWESGKKQSCPAGRESCENRRKIRTDRQKKKEKELKKKKRIPQI